MQLLISEILRTCMLVLVNYFGQKRGKMQQLNTLQFLEIYQSQLMSIIIIMESLRNNFPIKHLD